MAFTPQKPGTAQRGRLNLNPPTSDSPSLWCVTPWLKHGCSQQLNSRYGCWGNDLNQPNPLSHAHMSFSVPPTPFTMIAVIPASPILTALMSPLFTRTPQWKSSMWMSGREFFDRCQLMGVLCKCWCDPLSVSCGIVCSATNVGVEEHVGHCASVTGWMMRTS